MGAVRSQGHRPSDSSHRSCTRFMPGLWQEVIMKQLPIMNGAVSPAVRDEILGTKRRPVVLIGFQNQGNLGIGYLASTLRKNGYEVEVIDFEVDADLILERVKFLDPILVG